jgi:hypothetical protein
LSRIATAPILTSGQSIAKAIGSFDQEIAFLKTSRSYPRLEKLWLDGLDLPSALNYRRCGIPLDIRKKFAWHRTR